MVIKIALNENSNMKLNLRKNGTLLNFKRRQTSLNLSQY